MIPPGLVEIGIRDIDWMYALEQATEKNVEDEILLAVQECCALHDRWDCVYILSYFACLETSVLIDANDRVFIDWGLPGSVHLRQPVGAKIPFKLWVHTHPRMDTYWSTTDKNSLAFSTLLLQHAYVLGKQGIKYTQNSSLLEVEHEKSISNQAPLQYWSEEETEPWSEWYDTRKIVFEQQDSVANICWLSSLNQSR